MISMMFVGGMVAVGCVTAVAMAWIRSRSRRGSVSPELYSRLDEIGERIGRLDSAVEAVAVEVERISEGQRFTTRLLAERPAVQPIIERPRQPGTTTPH
jgi:hypothetical protein